MHLKAHLTIRLENAFLNALEIAFKNALKNAFSKCIF